MPCSKLFGLLAVGLLCFVPYAEGQGGKYNKKLKIGDPAPSFSDLPGVDGKKHSLADLSGKDVVVICITGNNCPVAVGYEERIINFTKKYAGPDSKAALVAINVNFSDDDKLPKMIERAAKKGFNFPYVQDESQKIAIALGASVTPEFYVLNKERKIVYMGAMDDHINATKVKTKYLENAVEAALKGQTPSVTETRPFGCTVEWK